MKRWNENEIIFIKENCNKMINKQFAEIYNCSTREIESILRKNKIKRDSLNTKPYNCKICNSPIGMTSKSMLCKKCYAKKYRDNNPNYNKEYYQQNKEEIKKKSKEWHIKNYNKALINSKKYREKINFNCNREKVLKNADYTCERCKKFFGKENSKHLVIHHKDRKGRNKIIKNNNLENLECLCRKCHMNEHRQELINAKNNR